MAKFKCIVSGNVIEFTNQVDIDSMVGHEGYIRLDDEVQAKEAVKAAPKKTTTKAATSAQGE